MMQMADQSVQDDCAVPGDLLGPLSIYTPGEGTYIRENSIYAAIAGFKKEISNGEQVNKAAIFMLIFL